MRLHVNGKDIEKQKIYIGFEGEKNYTEIEFDFSDVFSEYPEASAYMNIKPYKGEIYPHTLTREGTNLLVWNVNEADCTVPGVGMYQITFTYDNTVIKSFKGICVVRDSIIGSADPPTPVEEWIADASAALAALENITASAENLPERSDATAEILTVNGHKDIHIGVPKGDQGDQGEPGFSPTVTVTDIPNGHQVTVTDESGEHTFTVMNGEDGFSPQIAVTNITGGHRVSITDSQGTKSFDVMDGTNGADGTDGDDGFSPIITVTEITGGHRVSITDAEGTSTFDVMDGEIPQETLDQIEQDISDLNSALKDKADIIVSSASGAIASFPDGAESTAKELVVGIEPVQDLHGQDSPYPPGGGKNKFNVDAIVNSDYITVSNGEITVVGNSVNSGRTLSQLTDLTVGETYLLTANSTGVANYIYLSVAGDSWYFGTQRTITENDLNSVVRFYSGGSDVTATISNMMIRLSSVSDASFAPYSNICPISGWSGANVQRTGKNLIPNIKSQASGTTIMLGQTDGASVHSLFLKAGTYTLTVIGTVNGSIYGSSEKTLKGRIGSMPNCTFTLPEDDYISLRIYLTAGINADTISSFQLELGSTASSYSPYTAQSLPISFPSQAGTVYGGSLTVNEDGTGKLVVDRYNKSLTSFTGKSEDSSGYFWYDTVTNLQIPAIKGINAKLIIDRLKPVNGVSKNSNEGEMTFYENGILRWKEQGTLTLTEYSEYLASNPLEICYELSTPVEYTLSDLEVLELLKGVNNVWADTGDTSVTYRADTKLYIDNKLAELVSQIVNS